MAGPLKPISQYDYSGGANPVVSPYLVGPKQSQRLSNFILDEHGMLRTVDGTLLLSSCPMAEHRILMPFFWQPVGVAGQRLVIANPMSGIGGNILYDFGINPWSVIGPFTSSTVIPHYSVLNNNVVITDGYSSPRRWSGTFFGELTGLTARGIGGQITIEHEGFCYLFNTAQLTTATDGPSTLRQSDLNNPDSWNDAQVVFVAKDNGQAGRGLALFTVAEAGISPFDTLVLFKDTSTFQMTGNLGTAGGAPSSNFALQQVKTDMGCYAEKSIQFCAGFGVIRFTHRGFALFDGVDDKLISEEIRPYIFGRDDIVGLDWSHVFYSWAVQSPSPPLYICFCPTTIADRMLRAFIYDLVRRSWTIVDIPEASIPSGIASAGLLTPPNVLPEVLLGISPALGGIGNIQRWFNQAPDWNGSVITQTMRSKVAMDGGPEQRAYFRRLQVSVIADSSPVVITTVVYCSNGISKSSTYTLGLGTTTFFGFPSKLETTIDNTCEAAYFDLTAVGKCRITGHEFHIRKKPSIGSTSLIGSTT